MHKARSDEIHHREKYCPYCKKIVEPVLKDAEEMKKYNEEDRRYILGTLKRAYGRAKELLEVPVESIREEDIESLGSEFRQIDVIYKSRRCRGFVRNLLKRNINDLFRFVIDRNVEHANNRAERAIRPIVTYRKVSVGSRSESGAKEFARVYSVFETDRRSGKLQFNTDPG